jgi:hypothetical protein
VTVSLLKLSKKPKAPAAAAFARTGYRKPQPDLYTVLLVVALLAILVGILFLCLDMGTYEWKLKGGPAVGMLNNQRAGDSALVMNARQPSLAISPLYGEHGCSETS